MSLEQKRRSVIAETIKQIREIASGGDVDRSQLLSIKGAMIELAGNRDLFAPRDFPEPPPDQKDHCALYLLSQDDNGHLALYLQVINGKLDVPPHNHHTWAVIVGLRGCEKNRFYDARPDGPVQIGQADVVDGDGVALLPDDYHSIHLTEPFPIATFHLYGLALDQLPPRDFWSPSRHTWDQIAPQDEIIDRRAG